MNLLDLLYYDFFNQLNFNKSRSYNGVIILPLAVINLVSTFFILRYYFRSSFSASSSSFSMFLIERIIVLLL